jgi:transposase
MYRGGHSAQEVAINEQVSRATVYGIVKRYRYQYKGQDQPRSGCPLKLSERDKRHIMRVIDCDSFEDNEIFSHLAGLSGSFPWTSGLGYRINLDIQPKWTTFLCGGR